MQSNLNSISPVDGRYKKYTEALSKYFSESASMKYKILVECEYLIALSETSGLGIQKLTDKEKTLLRNVYKNFEIKDAEMVSDIELKGYKNIKATNHDFKAMEYYSKETLGQTSLKDLLEFVHFGLTSEDASNIAYALMISDSLEHVIIPEISKIISELNALAKKYKDLSMLSRTHGQPASPTTFGKEMKVFSLRLEKRLEGLRSIHIVAKLN